MLHTSRADGDRGQRDGFLHDLDVLRDAGWSDFRITEDLRVNPGVIEAIEKGRYPSLPLAQAARLVAMQVVMPGFAAIAASFSGAVQQHLSEDTEEAPVLIFVPKKEGQVEGTSDPDYSSPEMFLAGVERLRESGLSWEQIAARLHTTKMTLRSYRHGKTKPKPVAIHFLRLALAES